MKNVDVLIIGAGPAGSTVAKEVARNGFTTCIVEKDSFPGENKVCGGCVSVSGLPLEIPENVVEKKIYGCKTYFSWGEKSTASNSVNFYRREFDNFLANEAVNDGAKLLTSTYVCDVLKKDELMQVCLKSKKTSEKTQVMAKCVVFSDGPNTLANKKFNIGFNQRTDNTAIGAIYELEWDDNPLDFNEFYFDSTVSPWGYGWIIPKKNCVNVGVFCLLSKMKTNIRNSLDYFVKKHPIASKKLHDKKIRRFGAKLIPLEHASSISDERMLVIGDAAGMLNPIWAAGIHSSINAGIMAGNVLVDALNVDDLSKTRLSSYDKMWKNSNNYKALKTLLLSPKIVYNTIYGPLNHIYRFIW